jgi:nicotinamide mononucleotide transporter
VNSLEIAANVIMTLSIALAARNRVHTWPTGIVGCTLFMVLFFQNQLYADVTLQIFFIVTSVLGWWQWRHPAPTEHRIERPITRVRTRSLFAISLLGLVVALGYGWTLHQFTDAYLPYVDSAALILSVIAQFLLVRRNLEAWPFWLAVNTVSLALFASRGLYLTAALYTAYWFNAWYGWWRWRNELSQKPVGAVAV